MEVIRTFYVKGNFLQIRTPDGLSGVSVRVQGEDKDEISALNKGKGVEVLHRTKGLVDAGLRDLLSGRQCKVAPLNRKPPAPREVKSIEGSQK